MAQTISKPESLEREVTAQRASLAELEGICHSRLHLPRGNFEFMNHPHSVFVFQVQTPTASTLEELQRVFPQCIHVKADGPVMSLEIVDPTIATVDLASFCVRRECDRIRFVTGEDLNPRFVREILPDGTSELDF